MDDDALVRLQSRMNRVDSMTPELRQCVHEHGLSIVDAFLQAGVTKARHINHIIRSVREGSVEIGNRSKLDQLEREKEEAYSRFFRRRGYLVVPEKVSTGMVDASINALDTMGIAHTHVDRTRKHTIRLMLANVEGHAESFGKV